MYRFFYGTVFACISIFVHAAHQSKDTPAPLSGQEQQQQDLLAREFKMVEPKDLQRGILEDMYRLKPVQSIKLNFGEVLISALAPFGRHLAVIQFNRQKMKEQIDIYTQLPNTFSWSNRTYTYTHDGQFFDLNIDFSIGKKLDNYLVIRYGYRGIFKDMYFLKYDAAQQAWEPFLKAEQIPIATASVLNARVIYLDDNKNAYLCNLDEKTCRKMLNFDKKSISGLVLNLDGSYFAIYLRDDKDFAKIYDTQTNTLEGLVRDGLRELPYFVHPSITMSKDGKSFVYIEVEDNGFVKAFMQRIRWLIKQENGAHKVEILHANREIVVHLKSNLKHLWRSAYHPDSSINYADQFVQVKNDTKTIIYLVEQNTIKTVRINQYRFDEKDKMYRWCQYDFASEALETIACPPGDQCNRILGVNKYDEQSNQSELVEFVMNIDQTWSGPYKLGMASEDGNHWSLDGMGTTLAVQTRRTVDLYSLPYPLPKELYRIPEAATKADTSTIVTKPVNVGSQRKLASFVSYALYELIQDLAHYRSENPYDRIELTPAQAQVLAAESIPDRVRRWVKRTFNATSGQADRSLVADAKKDVVDSKSSAGTAPVAAVGQIHPRAALRAAVSSGSSATSSVSTASSAATGEDAQGLEDEKLSHAAVATVGAVHTSSTASSAPAASVQKTSGKRTDKP